MVASSLDAKVVLGGVTNIFFFFFYILDNLDFGFFLNSHFKVRNRRPHVLEAFREIASVFIS